MTELPRNSDDLARSIIATYQLTHISRSEVKGAIDIVLSNGSLHELDTYLNDLDAVSGQRTVRSALMQMFPRLNDQQ